MILRVIGLLVGLLAVAGCGGQEPVLVPFDGQVDKVQRVIVATSRSTETGAPPVYGDTRGEGNLFAAYDVSIPRERAPGTLSLPRGNPDPTQHFLVVGHNRLDGRAAFISELNRELANLPAGQGHVTVYVHGYNNNFASSVLRAAQIEEDFRLAGPTVAYSWPSAGKRTHYVYDRDSALYSRDRFVDMLDALAASRARSITILAHSMGTFLTMETLRTLQQTRDTRVLNKINAVVLAEPDIDVDVFRAQTEDIDLRRMAIAVIGSHEDRALKLSEFIAGGHPRVGEAKNVEELRRLGVIVIDVSGVADGTWTQHAAFEKNPELVELIGSGQLLQTIRQGQEGDDILIRSLHGVGNAAIAVAHLPYMLAD